MDEYNRFEKEILSKLQESGLIKKFSFSEVRKNPNVDVINDLFTYPIEISADDGGIFYLDENSDKVYCPSMSFSLTNSGEWLSDKIPPVTFDIDQSGNVRKASEAEALFCLIVISLVLKEDEFRNELVEVAKDYDFSNMKHFSDDSITFRGLLNSWQNYQSLIINTLVSACKFKISYYKKDIEKYLKAGMPKEVVVELRNLDAKIRSINFSYSEGELSPIRINKLTKIERLKIIDKRDQEIEENIKNSKHGLLYKLTKLSSEYISPIQKKKIQLLVKKEVDLLLETKDEFSSLKLERNQILSKIQRKALKIEIESIKSTYIEKYFNDPDNFKLPSKL